MVPESEILAESPKISHFCIHISHDSGFLFGFINQSAGRQTDVSVSDHYSSLFSVFIAKLAIYRLVKLHTKVNKSLSQLETFIFNEWKFHNTKALRLQTILNDEDKEKFCLDIITLDWEEYFHNLTIGIRLYLNKEKMSNLKTARVKDRM